METKPFALIQAIRSQPQLNPSPRVYGRLIESVTHLQASRPTLKVRTLWLVYTGLSVAIYLALWVAIRPGIVLEWAATNNDWAYYRVYRVETQSQHPILIAELPTQNQQNYHYIDPLLLPTQTYQYRVEGILGNGLAVQSGTIAGNPASALWSQVLLMISSLALGFVCILALRKKPLSVEGATLSSRFRAA